MASLEDVLKALKRQYGQQTVLQGTGYGAIERIPFGAALLDYSTYGGLPKNRLIELSGVENGGKSTTAQLLVASYLSQPDPKDVVYVDAEDTYSVEWAAKLGVDTSKVILIRPETMTAELVFQMVLDIINTGEVGLLVLDSIAVLVPQQVDAKSMEENQMGGISKPLTIFAQKVSRILAKKGCTLVCINQVRDNMTSYGQPLITVGGHGFKHTCSVRLQCASVYINDAHQEVSPTVENPWGVRIKVALKKSKCFPSNRKLASYDIGFVDGFDKDYDMLIAATLAGIVQTAGSSVRLLDEGEIIYKAVGRKAFLAGLSQEHKEFIKAALAARAVQNELT